MRSKIVRRRTFAGQLRPFPGFPQHHLSLWSEDPACSPREGVFNKLECNNVGWEMQTRRRAFGVYHAKLETFAGRGCNHGIADGDSGIRRTPSRGIAEAVLPNVYPKSGRDPGARRANNCRLGTSTTGLWVFRSPSPDRFYRWQDLKYQAFRWKSRRTIFMLARTIHGILDGEGNIRRGDARVRRILC